MKAIKVGKKGTIRFGKSIDELTEAEKIEFGVTENAAYTPLEFLQALGAKYGEIKFSTAPSDIYLAKMIDLLLEQKLIDSNSPALAGFFNDLSSRTSKDVKIKK